MRSSLYSLSASVVVAFSIGACSSGQVNLETAAAQGQPLSAIVSVNADGQLHADKLFVSKDAASGGEDDEDTDNVECEDGVTPSGAACDDDADSDDEAANEGGDEGGDEDTGQDESTGGEDDADSEGEDDADSEGDASADSGTAQVTSYLQGPAESSAAGLAVLGVDVNPGSSLIPQGTTRLVGDFQGGLFTVSTIQTASRSLAMGGVSEGIQGVGADIWSVRLLGQSLLVDGDTEIVPLSNPADTESLDTEDADGVNCEQSGDHQGDNQGC